MTRRLMIPCDICKHLRGEMKCGAFPEGIPDEIQYLGYDHRKEYKGDNGIRFEIRPSCNLCENYIGNKKCLAFKKIIPEIIYMGHFIHDKEYPGDKGYRFKPSFVLMREVFKRIRDLRKYVNSLSNEKKELFLREIKEKLNI